MFSLRKFLSISFPLLFDEDGWVFIFFERTTSAFYVNKVILNKGKHAIFKSSLGLNLCPFPYGCSTPSRLLVQFRVCPAMMSK